MNIDVFLKDKYAEVVRMMRLARQENAVMSVPDENGNAKHAMVMFYFDDPKYNQRFLDLIAAEGVKLDAEREAEETVKELITHGEEERREED